MKPIIYYGQNREDIIIDCFFPDVKKGFYVDVGAHDPVKDSVTKYFYKKGWHGINIEPQKKLYKKLVQDRKRDINLNIGIAAKPGKLKFRSYKSDGLSTFSNEVKESLKKDSVDIFTDSLVEVDTLSNVLNNNNVGTIHFLKVDVEGFESEVLQSNNWDKYKPQLICIESNHRIKDWDKFITARGYKLAFFDGLNEYYVSKEQFHRIELSKKRVPQKLVSAPILSFAWHRQIRAIEKQLDKVQSALDSQRIINSRLENELENKQKQLDSYKSIKFSAKQLKNQAINRLKKN